MKKTLATVLASVSFLVANAAFAAPSSASPAEQPCAHCVKSGTMAINTTGTRGATFSQGNRPCLHVNVAAARWGANQKPCPHCTHSA